ncbi:MAG: glycosyltransferase [Planctomycetes bacterium]|nr:glycosyltransferase [Planctomycetota bacterium]
MSRDLRRFAYLCADPGIPVPGTKGASIHVASVVQALCDQGLCGSIHTVRPTEAELWGVPVEELPFPPRRKGESDAERELRLFGSNGPLQLDTPRPDFIYERYSLWHHGGLAEARRLGIPFVLEVNSPLPEEASRFRSMAHPRAALGVAEVLMKNADGIVCVSEAIASWVRELGAPTERSWVVPNGGDETTFDPSREPRPLPFVGTPVVLIFVG